MISVAKPLRRNGEFAGVVGMDIAMKNMQEMLATIHPYQGQGYLTLISPGGIYAANGLQPELVGKEIQDPEWKKIILEGSQKKKSKSTKKINPHISSILFT
ncbi:cache domain protein [Leptospira interrogans serovar Bataviae str. HAI135]|nr:cache domain protein [Leptospira interrogans serovar Bataviae str. HAI135]